MVFTYVKIIQHYLILAMIFVVSMFWLRPYLEENTRFIYDCRINSDSIVLETIVLACQYYALGATMPIVLGYDYVYFAYAVHMVLQLKLLNHKFKNINVDTTLDNIRQYVNYHQFLLS